MKPHCLEVAQTLQVESAGNVMFRELVIDKLQEHRFIQITDDSEGGKFLQQSGIDYFLVAPTGFPHLISLELKVEQRNTWGTLFLEVFQNVFPTRPGWLQSCSAELLIYGFIKPEPVFYIMGMAELRALILETPLFAYYPCRTQKRRELASTAAGFSVPVADLRDSLKHFFEIKQQTPRDVISAALTLAI